MVYIDFGRLDPHMGNNVLKCWMFKKIRIFVNYEILHFLYIETLDPDSHRPKCWFQIRISSILPSRRDALFMPFKGIYVQYTRPGAVCGATLV
jgi:hypothetical protein